MNFIQMSGYKTPELEGKRNRDGGRSVSGEIPGSTFPPLTFSSSMEDPMAQLMAKESVLIRLGFGDLDSWSLPLGTSLWEKKSL